MSRTIRRLYRMMERARTSDERPVRPFEGSLLEWSQHYLSHHFRNDLGETFPPSRFHKELCELLDGWRVLPRGQRLAVEAPRGNAKSMYASLAYPLREAIEGREAFTVILSDTFGQVRQFLKTIRDEIESNATIARDYPSVAGGGPVWRDDMIELRNGCAIKALSTGGKIRGLKHRQHRPTCLVLDDVQNKDHIVSALKRRRSWEWFTKDVLSAGSPRTNILSVGTPHHREDIVCGLRTMAGWTHRRYPAIEQWPVRMDLWETWKSLLQDFTVDEAERSRRAREFLEANRAEMHR